jgi:hypothetical protein
MTIVEAARESAGKKLLFLPHAVRQMTRPERMITPQEVERVVMMGELVEDYPHDSEVTAVCSWDLATRGGRFMWCARPRSTIWL